MGWSHIKLLSMYTLSYKQLTIQYKNLEGDLEKSRNPKVRTYE